MAKLNKTMKSSPKDNSTPAKKRRKIAQDDGEANASGQAPESSELARSEFTEAFDLTGISKEMKQKLYQVAPVLLGQEVVYTKEFFTDVVGLSGRGILLSKLAGFEYEVQEKWPPTDNRYEIVECLDSDEAASFIDHWSKVYGNGPDNNYFSMQFLQGCYATFVHNMEINWAQEALDRRSRREKNPIQNPRKLGPIALRQQIEAICKLVAGNATKQDSGVKSLEEAKDELQQCKEDELKAKSLKCRLLKQLKDVEEGVEGCYTKDESDDLNVLYMKAMTEAKTLRTKGVVKEEMAKRAEAAALLTTITERSQLTNQLEETIVEMKEELLPKTMVDWTCTTKSVEEAEERVKSLMTCPGCKDALAKKGNHRAGREPNSNAPSLSDPKSNLDLPPPKANQRNRQADREPSSDSPYPSDDEANLDLPPPKAAANVDLPNPPNAVADVDLPSSPNVVAEVDLPSSLNVVALPSTLNALYHVNKVPADAICNCLEED